MRRQCDRSKLAGAHVLVAALLALAGGRAAAQEPVPDLARLQGVWRLQSIRHQGQVHRADLWLLVDGDRVTTLTRKGLGARAARLELDEVEKRMDLGEWHRAQLGLYKLEGDTWTFCVGREGGERTEALRAAVPDEPIWTFKHVKPRS